MRAAKEVGRLVAAGEADRDWQRRKQGKKSQRQVAEPVQMMGMSSEATRQAETRDAIRRAVLPLSALEGRLTETAGGTWH